MRESEQIEMALTEHEKTDTVNANKEEITTHHPVPVKGLDLNRFLERLNLQYYGNKRDPA